MAKKHEFQPDRPYSTWLNKLQLTRLQRKQALKWSLYALVLLILSVVQDVILCRVRFFGGTTDLVPCGIFLICILEGTDRGCIFALVASTLFLLSGVSPGPHVLVLITVLAVLVSALRQTYLHPPLPAMMLSTLLAMTVYELSIFCVCLLLGQVTVSRFGHFLVPAVLSLVVVPLIYPVAKAIGTIGGEAWKE